MGETHEQSFEVELALPPSANRYWRYYRGTIVRSKEASEYIRDVSERILEQLRRRPVIPRDASVSLVIDIYCQRRRDLSNCLKVLEDALALALLFDDTQTCEIILRKHEVVRKDDYRAIVRLSWTGKNTT